MTKRRTFSLFSGLLLFTCDFFAVYLGYVFSYFVYVDWVGGNSPQSLAEVTGLAVIPAFLALLSFILTSVYRCEPGPLGLDQLRRLLSAYFWSGMMSFSLTFFTKSFGFSRLMVGMGFMYGLLFVLLGRAIYVRVMAPLRSNLNLNRKILILGAGKVGTALARNLLNTRGSHEVTGFLDDQYPGLQSVSVKIGEKVHEIPVIGKLAELEQIVRDRRINEVIVAMTQAAHALHQDLFDRVKDLNISFSIVPSALDLMLTGAEAYSIGRIPLFRIGRRPEFVLSPVLKRALDMCGALIIGGLSSPLWLVSSVLIKLDSPGPVLFVHERVGKDGRKFKLYKFRSMRIDVDPYAVTPANQQDPRITKIGRMIRRSSIDELPQLLNVIRGDMSLVGPRPEMPFIVQSYDDLQKLRLSVKPGLTGVWQISADRANPIHENIDYDLYYLENQSFWLDLAILIKTFTSVLKGVGAY